MATEHRGYTTAPGTTAPDVPYWLNRALGEIDTDVEAVEDRVVNLEVQAGTAPGGINDAAMSTVYLNESSTFRQDVEADRAATLAGLRAEIAAAKSAATPVFGPWTSLASWLKNGWKPSTGTDGPEFRKITWPGGVEEMVFRGQLVAPANVSGNSIAFYLNEAYRPTGGTLYFALGVSTSIAMNVRIGAADGAATFWSSSASGALRPLNNIRFFRD